MADPIFDRKEQLETITGLLVGGEAVEAVFDCKGAGTGFIGITTKRVVYFDKDLGGKKRKVIMSIPYSRIASIGTEGERGFFGGSSVLLLIPFNGAAVDFEFRGSDKAQKAHEMVLRHLLALELTWDARSRAT